MQNESPDKVLVYDSLTVDIDEDKALNVLENLDAYIVAFQEDTGLPVTPGAKKIIIEALLEKINPNKLN